MCTYTMNKLKEAAATELRQSEFRAMHPYALADKPGNIVNRFSNYWLAKETASWRRLTLVEDDLPKHAVVAVA